VCKVAFNRDKDWVDLREMLAIQGRGVDVAYALGWLGEMLGSEDPRTVRFRDLAAEAQPRS